MSSGAGGGPWKRHGKRHEQFPMGQVPESKASPTGFYTYAHQATVSFARVKVARDLLITNSLQDPDGEQPGATNSATDEDFE